MNFDLDVWRDSRKAITNAAGGAIMSFPIAGGEDQDFFHNSCCETRQTKADATLMDIWIRQSKLWAK